MKNKDLKLFTLFYINEHDKLTKVEKLKLMDFSSEASKTELLNLLISGNINSKHIVTKEEEEQISEIVGFLMWPLVSYMSYGAGLKDGMGAIALVSIASAVSYKIYKQYLTKAAKACKDKKGLAKEECMTKFKREGLKKQLNILQKGLVDCKNTKDPKLCQEKMKKKIDGIKNKLKK